MLRLNDKNHVLFSDLKVGEVFLVEEQIFDKDKPITFFYQKITQVVQSTKNFNAVAICVDENDYSNPEILDKEFTTLVYCDMTLRVIPISIDRIDVIASLKESKC